MANKVYQIAFQLAGSVGSGFAAAFGNGSKQMQNMKKEMKDLNAESKQLDSAYKQGIISAEAYGNAQSQVANRLKLVSSTQKNLVVATNNYRNAQRNLSSAMSSFRSSLVTATVVAAPFVWGAKVAVGFEKSMSRVKAITGANAEEFKALSARAREMGASTQFTASEAAQAMTNLGMAGWKTNQIIDAMPGLLNLAIIGETSLAETSTIVTGTLNAFGLSAKDAGHMADVFAVAATTTATDVSQIGQSMKYAAPIASAFGASLEETTAMAGLMANANIKATESGTALRAGLLRLSGPPKAAQKAMSELGMSMSDMASEQTEAKAALDALGISMTDGEGKSRKITGVIRDLQTALSGMTGEQKLANLSAIFGQRAAGAWLAVINQGPDKLDKLTTALEKSDGAADKMAATIKGNAAGSLKAMQSALEDTAISVGSIFLPSIAAGAQSIQGMANAVAQAAAQYPTLTKVIVGVTFGLLGLLIACKAVMLAQAAYNLVVTAGALLHAKYAASVVISKGTTIAATAATNIMAVAQWALNVAMAACPFMLIIIGIGLIVAAGYVLYQNWDKIKAFFISLWDDPAGAIRSFANVIYEALGGAFKWIRDTWEGIKKIFSQPLTVTVQKIFSGGGTNYESTANPGYAAGGLVSRPTLAWIAEGGDEEMVIPLNNSPRSKGLWSQAGAMLGLGGGSKKSVVFNPVINIQGNASADTVGQMRTAMQESMAQFEAKLNAVQARRERLAYD